MPTSTGRTLLAGNGTKRVYGQFMDPAGNSYFTNDSITIDTQAPVLPEWMRANKWGGTNFDNTNAITLDTNGNSYVAGYFAGTTKFGTTTLISSGFNDSFVGKISSTGAFLRAVK